MANSNPVAAREALSKLCSKREACWRSEANTMWEAQKTNPLFMLGIGLYWGEGLKAEKRLSLTNSDPRLIETWVAWCRAFIPNVDFRARVQVAQTEESLSAVEFWSKILGSDCLVRVLATRSKASSKRYATTRPLAHGTLTVTVRRGSAEWFTKMSHFIDLSLVSG